MDGPTKKAAAVKNPPLFELKGQQQQSYGSGSSTTTSSTDDQLACCLPTGKAGGDGYKAIEPVPETKICTSCCRFEGRFR
jgi:hypothetical protein